MKIKIFTLLLFAAFLFTNVFSQPTITNQKDIGGTGGDKQTCIDITKDGGLIVGGFSNSPISGQKTDTNRGKNDYWIVKLDSLQHIGWDKTIGGSNTDYLEAIEQTSDGGYILGGSSSSDISGEKTGMSKGSFDYWVVKIDPEGEIEWDKTIGGNKSDGITSLQQTNDGGYIIGGVSSSDSSGNKTQHSKGGNDYWIVKLTDSGHVQWNKTIGGNADDELHALQQTNDGGYILGGTSSSNISGNKTQKAKGSSDYWIIKLNSLGNIEWDKTIGGTKTDELKSIRQTQDNGYIIGGYSLSDISGNKTENSKGYSDYWIVKLNSTGHIEWDKDLGGNAWDDLNSIEQTRDKGYILSGSSSSKISGDKTENGRGEYDYWVVKLNSSGHVQWDKTIGGTSNDILPTIKEIRKDHYVIGGYSMSNISGDKTKDTRGGDDYWIVYLDYNDTANLISSSNKISLQNTTTAITKNFSAYPNPVKDILYVQSKTKAVFSLTDQSGKTILIKTIEGNGEINVGALVPGLYYLKNNDTGVSQKVVVVK